MKIMKWRIIGVDSMKKILNLLLVLMLMGSIASLAFADEAGDNDQGTSDNNHDNHQGTLDNETNQSEQQQNNSYENETEHEIEIMNTSLGAEIRLLQLEKAVITNLLKGTMIVQVLKGLEVNTTQLEGILGNLRDVLNEVRTADPAANNSVQIFVELKNRTRSLTKEFRDTLRALLDKDTIKHIKEQLRNMTSDELKNCSKKILNRIRHFNRNQLYRLYGLVGETNDTLLKEYLNGKITLNQTKLQLHKQINQMTKEKRSMIYSEIKEENIKKQIKSHASIDDIKHHGKANNHGKNH